MTLCNKFPLRNTCPTHVFCLSLILATRLLSSSACCSTTQFCFLSVQLMFSMFLHNHIYSASSLCVSAFFSDHVSAPWSAMLHISTFNIFFFSVRCSFPPRSVFLSLNAVLAIAILVYISCSHRPFSVMTLPRYRNCFICSISFPLIVIFTFFFLFSL